VIAWAAAAAPAPAAASQPAAADLVQAFLSALRRLLPIMAWVDVWDLLGEVAAAAGAHLAFGAAAG
jgi:hypothetical protein